MRVMTVPAAVAPGVAFEVDPWYTVGTLSRLVMAPAAQRVSIGLAGPYNMRFGQVPVRHLMADRAIERRVVRHRFLVYNLTVTRRTFTRGLGRFWCMWIVALQA